MPLLRDELRAGRQRQGLVLAALGTVGVLGVVAALVVPSMLEATPAATAPAPAVPAHVGLHEETDAGLPEIAAPAPTVVAPPEPLHVEPTTEHGGGLRSTHAFGRSLGFRPALTSTGLSGAEADSIIAALTGVMDFRRCRPEHQFVVERDAAGQARRFEYRASITQIYEAVREGERWVGRQVEVPIERIRLARGGVVGSSLGAALEAAGLGRSLVGTLVETFEGKIDFNTETRAGDAFRIVVEEERLNGELLRYGTVAAVEYRSQRRGVLRAFWFESREGDGDFHDETGRAVHGGWLRTPLRYDHISSPFDPRRMHPVLRRIHPHNGIDFAAPSGTPIWAAADGEVTFVGPKGANGNLISLRHDGGYETFYCHLSRFATGLRRGMRVEQRQPIGYVGSTGRSTGPHLHFGLKRHGTFLDPARELNGPGRLLTGAQLQRFRGQLSRLRGELDAIVVPDVAVGAAHDDAPAATSESMD